MKFDVTTPPTTRPVDWLTAKAHLRLDGVEEKSYVESLIDAAADYAQEALAASLLPQTITAVYYADDMPSQYDGGLSASFATHDLMAASSSVPWQRPSLTLPRGPVTSITSVTDGNSQVIGASFYRLERVGRSDRVFIGSLTFPITVVYVAGYTAVPASIKHAILMHVGTLHENRESISEKSKVSIPHSLEEFYRLRARNTGIGSVAAARV